MAVKEVWHLDVLVLLPCVKTGASLGDLGEVAVSENLCRRVASVYLGEQVAQRSLLRLGAVVNGRQSALGGINAADVADVDTLAIATLYSVAVVCFVNAVDYRAVRLDDVVVAAHFPPQCLGVVVNHVLRRGALRACGAVDYDVLDIAHSRGGLVDA